MSAGTVRPRPRPRPRSRRRRWSATDVDGTSGRWRAAPAPTAPAGRGSRGRELGDRGGRSVIGQSGEQGGIVWPISGVVGRHVQSELPAGRRGQYGTLQRVEPIIASKQALVVEQRPQVWIPQHVATHEFRRRNQPKCGRRDDGHLAEASAHGLEQGGVAVGRARTVRPSPVTTSSSSTLSLCIPYREVVSPTPPMTRVPPTDRSR